MAEFITRSRARNMKSIFPAAANPFFVQTRFGDHDELCALIQGGSAEFIQKGRGAFEGDFTFIGLDAGTLQFGYIKLPYLGRGASSVERLGFLVRLDLRGDWIWRGQTLDRRSIIYFAPRAEYQDNSPGNSSWAFLSFNRPSLERAMADIAAIDASLPAQGLRLFLPQADAFEVLRRRLKAVQAAAQTDPSLLQVPEARRGVEESVLAALALALGSASRIRPADDGAATRLRVTRLVDAHLDTHRGEAVYLSDLCAVAGVGERTLRTVFQETYGMSPVQYLKLRRLHQVKRALRRADSDLNTVQSVANRFGIWHLGRFAVEYRALFGESPLETLKKPGRQESAEPSVTLAHHSQ